MEDQPTYIPCMTLFWIIDVALFFFIKTFLMWIIFKVFIELLTVLLLVYVWFFWSRGMWNLSSLTGLKPAPSALEGEVLTTGPPGKSQMWLFKCSLILVSNTSLWTWGEEAFQPCSDIFNSQFGGRWEKIPFFSVTRFLQFHPELKHMVGLLLNPPHMGMLVCVCAAASMYLSS